MEDLGDLEDTRLAQDRSKAESCRPNVEKLDWHWCEGVALLSVMKLLYSKPFVGRVFPSHDVQSMANTTIQQPHIESQLYKNEGVSELKQG